MIQPHNTHLLSSLCLYPEIFNWSLVLPGSFIFIIDEKHNIIETDIFQGKHDDEYVYFERSKYKKDSTDFKFKKYQENKFNELGKK